MVRSGRKTSYQNRMGEGVNKFARYQELHETAYRYVQEYGTKNNVANCYRDKLIELIIEDCSKIAFDAVNSGIDPRRISSLIADFVQLEKKRPYQPDLFA